MQQTTRRLLVMGNLWGPKVHIEHQRFKI